MGEWLALLQLIAVVFGLGGIWLWALSDRSGRFSGEGLFASLVLGLLVLGWVAFLLAELGWFSLSVLGWVWLGLMALGIGLIWWGSPSKNEPQRREGRREGKNRENSSALSASLRFNLPLWLETAVLVVWVMIASWLYLRPHEYIWGGADAGVYLSLSANIAQTGAIAIYDDDLAQLDPALHDVVLRQLETDSPTNRYLFPGFFVTSQPLADVIPQFYHLHPVWQAVAYEVAQLPPGSNQANGMRAALLLPGVWALLASLAIYGFTRRIAGWPTAVLVLVALAVNGLQVWFGRYPTTEPLTQFLLFAGLWSLAIWLDEERPLAMPAPWLWAFLAGTALGQLFLVRIDMLFILPVLGLFLLWQIGRGAWTRAHWAFWLPLGGLITHSLAHGWWQSRPYFLDLFGYGLRIAGQNGWVLLLGGWLTAVLLVVAYWQREQLRRLRRYRQGVLGAVIMALLLVALYSWFIRPASGTVASWLDPYSNNVIPLPNRDNWRRLGWYLSPVGVWLGMAGIGLMVWRVRRQTAVFLGISLFFTLFYLWNLRANPHQVYAMRRLIPAVIPLFTIAPAVLISWIMGRWSRWGLVGGLLLTAVWLAGLGWNARGLISQVDEQGVTEQLQAMNAQFEPDSVLLFNDTSPVGNGDFWGTPLKFVYGHTPFVLRYPENLEDRALVRMIEQWHNDGRAVYWLGDTGWVTAQGLTIRPEASIKTTIRSQRLEQVYEYRPTAVVPVSWQMEFFKIEP